MIRVTILKRSTIVWVMVLAGYHNGKARASLVALSVKNLPAMQETQV